MKRFSILGLILFHSTLSLTLFNSCLFAANPWPDSSYLYRQFNGGGNTMNYRLYVPPNYDATSATKHPVVIFAHGDGEKQNGMIVGNPNVANSSQLQDNGQYSFVTTANQALFPCFFILVQRQGPSSVSTAIRDMVNSLGSEFKSNADQSKIDLDRIIVTGLSGGGGTTLECINAHPGFYTAAVPLSAPPPNAFAVANILSVPLWLFHSNNDSTVQSSNSLGIVHALRRIGGRPIFTLYDTGGHSAASWGAAYSTPPLIPWLADQRRGIAQTNDPATVTITSPSSQLNFGSPTLTVTISGTVGTQPSANSGITVVDYAKGDYYDLGQWPTNAPTSGTIANWTFSNAQPINQYNTNPFIFNIVAKGTSWSASLGGRTYYSDTISVIKPTSAYMAWKHLQFGVNALNTSITADTVDYDGDGVANILEYALSTNPTLNENSASPVVNVVADHLQMNFTRIAPTDITYTVESSSDLVTWNTSATLAANGTSWIGSATVNETGSGATRTVIVQDPVASSGQLKRFLRLKITQP